jgi:hypothetical protein
MCNVWIQWDSTVGECLDRIWIEKVVDKALGKVEGWMFVFSETEEGGERGKRGLNGYVIDIVRAYRWRNAFVGVR